MTGLSACRIIELPTIRDPRGALTVVHGGRDVPFEVRRTYHLYDVPGGSSRGGHAHRSLHQLIIPMTGSFDVLLRDGQDDRRVTLNRSYHGLLVCPMIWREIDNFSTGAVCLVLASEHYDEDDYIREYDDFVLAVSAP